MSIVISGRGKSGTTGMYNTIKASLPENDPAWVCLFEPSKPDYLESLRTYSPESPVLTKVMLTAEAKGGVRPATFDHRVMMIRDPFDVVISTLLFRPLVVRSMRRVTPEGNERFLQALQEKESDPTSWSVRDLFILGNEVGLARTKWTRVAKQFEKLMRREASGRWFAMRYENLVDERFGELSDYLGFAVAPETPADTDGDASWLAHISRSKGYGAWRHWFHESDVEFYLTIFADFCERFGYTDWTLAEHPAIDPATSSHHIRTRLDGRREQMAAAQGEVPLEAFTSEQLATLEGQASDGIVVAQVQAAEVRRHGPPELRDLEASYRWARLATWLGNERGRALLVESHEAGFGDPSELDPQAV